MVKRVAPIVIGALTANTVGAGAVLSPLTVKMTNTKRKVQRSWEVNAWYCLSLSVSHDV